MPAYWRLLIFLSLSTSEAGWIVKEGRLANVTVEQAFKTGMMGLVLLTGTMCCSCSADRPACHTNMIGDESRSAMLLNVQLLHPQALSLQSQDRLRKQQEHQEALQAQIREKQQLKVSLFGFFGISKPLDSPVFLQFQLWSCLQ